MTSQPTFPTREDPHLAMVRFFESRINRDGCPTDPPDVIVTVRAGGFPHRPSHPVVGRVIAVITDRRRVPDPGVMIGLLDETMGYDPEADEHGVYDYRWLPFHEIEDYAPLGPDGRRVHGVRIRASDGRRVTDPPFVPLQLGPPPPRNPVIRFFWKLNDPCGRSDVWTDVTYRAGSVRDAILRVTIDPPLDALFALRKCARGWKR